MAKAISDGVEFMYTLNTDSDYVDYEIRTSTETIYTGRGYPIGAYVYFNLTNIMEDYCNLNGIKDNIYLFTNSFGNYDNFKFEYFVYIKEELQTGFTQFNTDKLFSMYLDDNNTFDFVNGKSLQMKTSYDITKDCWILYNYLGTATNISYGESPISGSGYSLHPSTKSNPQFYPFYWFIKGDVPEYEYVNISLTLTDKVKYHILPCTKATGCIYWVNRFGGFETLLVNGKVNYSTDNTSTNYQQSSSKVINGTLYKRTFNQGNTIIKRDITKKWTLNSSYLLDTDWTWIESLYTSPIVYYQDFANNIINSVIISDNTFSKQLFKENGKKIPNYEINIESSIKNIRR